MDAAAQFSDLALPHVPRLYRLGLRLTHQPSESSDLVQEALTRAWANWSSFDRGGSLGAYLSRILYNTFVSRHRHQRVVQTTAARADIAGHLFDRRRMEEADAPEATWHRDDLSDEVVAALEALPQHYREVVERVDLAGLAYKDAAAELGIPLGTVMSRLHRARKLMRGSLTEYAAGFGFAAAAA
ncbi:MAG: sigma-70 family RNA polymerase sigma factor [Nannocystaceae bacterium]|nr:sigma-70 family RNA polymerase sigma factor [bacterium]